MPVGAIATKCVLGEVRTAGDRERRGMADGSARVPEVLSAAELEGFFAGFVPELLEPALGASMGEEAFMPLPALPVVLLSLSCLVLHGSEGSAWARTLGVHLCSTYDCSVGLWLVGWWCVVLLKRYLGIVWGPGYPHEVVRCFIDAIFSGALFY